MDEGGAEPASNIPQSHEHSLERIKFPDRQTSSFVAIIGPFRMHQNSWTPRHSSDSSRRLMNAFEAWAARARGPLVLPIAPPPAVPLPPLPDAGDSSDPEFRIVPNPQNAPAAATSGSKNDPITDPVAFLAWFSSYAEPAMAKAALAHAEAARTRCTALADAADAALAAVDDAANALAALGSAASAAARRSQGLQDAADALAAQHARQSATAAALAEALAVLDAAEAAAKFLAAPGDAPLVLDARFPAILAKLDAAAAFLAARPGAKDAPLLRIRVAAAAARALGLVRIYAVDALRTLAAEARTSRTSQTLTVARFRSLAAHLRPLIALIEERIHLENVQPILADCASAYLSIRRSIIAPIVAARIAAIEEESKSGFDPKIAHSAALLAFAKNACAYMIQLCADEYHLARLFFTHPSIHQNILAFLESIATILSDQLRPLILRESSIDTLSDLCNTLASYIHSIDHHPIQPPHSPTLPVQDPFSDVGDISDQNSDLDHIDASPVKFIAQRILQDAQQRLAFRSETFIRQELQLFRPREQELLVLARGRGLPQPASIQLAVGVAPVLSESIESADSLILPMNLQSSSRRNSSVSIAQPSDPTDASANNQLKQSPQSQTHPSPKETLPNQQIDEPIQFDTAPGMLLGKIAYGGGEWYPTLQRTLYILSRLYSAVPQTIFEDLAQDAIESCTKSLSTAASILVQKQSKLDGQLFLVKNLLMLRENISSLDARFVRGQNGRTGSLRAGPGLAEILEAVRDAVQTAWSNGMSITSVVTAAATAVATAVAGANTSSSSLISQTSSISPTSINAVTPAIHSYTDAKDFLDLQLRQTCEEIILETSKSAVEPLASFMLKVAAFRLRQKPGSIHQSQYPNRPSTPLSSQSFADPTHLRAIYTTFIETVQTRLSFVVTKMCDYIGDKKTRDVLIRIMRSHILEAYQSFLDVAISEYGDQDGNLVDEMVTMGDMADLVDETCEKASMKSALPPPPPNRTKSAIQSSS